MYIDVVSLFLNADHARVQYTTQYAHTYALYRAGAAGLRPVRFWPYHVLVAL